MDKEALALSQTVAAKVRPHYQKWIQKKVEAAQAYARAYDEVVELVAKAQNMGTDKVKFASRDVLQEAMDLVTQ